MFGFQAAAVSDQCCGCVAEGLREQTMWWKTDRHAERQPVRFEGSSLAQNFAHRKPVKRKLVPPASEQSTSVRSTPRHRRLRLPISSAQAAANLLLQESGADCHAEIPRLRKDIRALEAGLRDQTLERDQANRSLLTARDHARSQRERIGDLEAQLEVSKQKYDHALLQSSEQQKWLMLTAELFGPAENEMWAAHQESQQQVEDLLAMLTTARSENRSLVDQLETRERENRIFSDVIDDMETRRERELSEQRQQREETETRRRGMDEPERAEVQQLNMRIVCQAAEIRSLNKQVAELKSDVSCDHNNYTTVMDDGHQNQSGEDFRRTVQLNARLEKSLQAVRNELDSAVHELTYANAEILRLKDQVACVELNNETEVQGVVQVAELHAIYAATLEKEIHANRELECVTTEPAAPVSSGWDQLMAEGQIASRAKGQSESDVRSPAVRAQQLEIDVFELQEANQELQSLRVSQTKVIGENEKLSAINRDLNRSKDAIQAQLADSMDRHSQEKSEWKTLLVHHEQNTHVARTECDLVKSQLEEQKTTYERKLKQQDELIEGLKTEVAGFQLRQTALEMDLEGEQLQRTISDREVQRLENEVARIHDAHATDADALKPEAKQTRDEHGGEPPVRSVLD